MPLGRNFRSAGIQHENMSRAAESGGQGGKLPRAPRQRRGPVIPYYAQKVVSQSVLLNEATIAALGRALSGTLL